uniref:Uncharacterized protein n=1 Tax=Tetranychus urticae TaxID=32264 RepID=T1K1R4_TETUR
MTLLECCNHNDGMPQDYSRNFHLLHEIVPLVEFCDCVFITFGPSMTMFCFKVANYPIQIIMTSSCFFWLCVLASFFMGY